MKKVFSISKEISEEEQKKIDEIIHKYGMDENEIFFMSIKIGFLNGAKDYQSAFEIGFGMQEKILEQMPKATHLQKVANVEHSSANVVQDNLANNINIDDSLMDKIISEISGK